MALVSLKVSAAVAVAGQAQPGTVQVRSVRVGVASTTGLSVISGAAGPAGPAGPAGAGAALDYFVKAAGNDSLDGKSAANAWASVAKVNSVSFNPGDTVSFNGGDTFATELDPSTSGRDGQFIKFRSYGTGKATLSGGTFAANKSYLAFEDLIINTAVQMGGVAGPVNHLELTACDITLAGGLNSANCILGWGSHWRIRRCKLTGSGDSAILAGFGTQGNAADSEDLLIEGCRIVNTGTNNTILVGVHAIYCKFRKATIRGNTITDFRTSAISSRYQDAVITDNVIQRGFDVASVGIGHFPYDPSNPGTTIIANNVITEVVTPIFVPSTDNGVSTSESFVVYDNRWRGTTAGGKQGLLLNKTLGAYTFYNNQKFPEFVKNGSFESAIGAEWYTTAGFNNSVGATLTQDASFATYPIQPSGTLSVDAGVKSGKVVTTNALAHEGPEQDLGILASGQYYGTVYVKGNAGGESLELVVGSSGQSVVVAITATTSWVAYPITFYGDGTNHVFICVRTASATALTFFLDDFSVTS